MFHDIPDAVLKRMRVLEEIDARDRLDGTPKASRLRQIPAESGRFLALLLAGAPRGAVLEVGTSAGYSSLWLSLACKLRAEHLTTFEILPEKIVLASETFQQAGVAEFVQLVTGDARQLLADWDKIAFCFLDADKEIYAECYELVVPRLLPGGILAADNAISHPELQPFIDFALADPRVDALVVPVGKGILVCRKSDLGE
jgi:predicted O-methyltransferase YrrM